MKKAALILIIVASLLICATAYADTTPTPDVEADAPENASAAELISYRSTGETVVRIQMRLRELGYFNFRPTGNYQSLTVSSVIAFQQNQTDSSGHAIISDGTIGEQSMQLLFTTGVANRAIITASIPFGDALTGEATLTGSLVGWADVSAMLSEGATYTVTDYNTGITFNMVFAGGDKHAEMECASAADTQKYKDAFGGEFNYSKRPVVISIGGQNIAASLQGFPHGEDSVAANDMAGHSCMYFDGSLSHVGSMPDVEHIRQIYIAAGRG